MTNKKIPTGTIFLFSLLLLVMLITYVLTKPSPPPPELTGVLRPEFKALHPFKLTDQNNIIFDEKRFQRKWSFVFFGYTSCPDICPTTLNVLRSVQVLLDDKTKENPANTQVVFISVDPARDTPEVLTTYMSYFNKNFIGVTADKNEINSFARQFGAGYVLEKRNCSWAIPGCPHQCDFPCRSAWQTGGHFFTTTLPGNYRIELQKNTDIFSPVTKYKSP